MKIRYVYYDKSTGLIKEILPSKKRGRSPYIECDFEEVRGFIDGTKGINQYVIAYNTETEKHSLIKKNNIIMFRKMSKKLYKIPYRKNIESDLKIVYYPDNILEIIIDMTRISPLYQTNFRDEVYFERGTEIRIFCYEKNSGEKLKEIIINAQELLESGQMFFELPPHIKSDNIEFFTYQLFENYSWNKDRTKLISPMKERIKFDIHQADNKVRKKDFSYHLIIKPTPDGISIKNNIENLKLIRFNKSIEFFIVDRHDPNILYGKFFLDKADLKKKKINVDLKVNIQGKSILYNQKYISVLLKG